MMKRINFLLLVVVAAVLLLLVATASGKQSFSVPIITPVSGFMVFVGNQPGISSGAFSNQLFLSDTSSGITQLLKSDSLYLSSPLFSTTGETIAFSEGQVGIQTYHIPSMNFTTVLQPVATFDVQTWSPDSTQIMYISFDFDESDERFHYDIDLLHLEDGTTTRLFSYMDGDLLTDFPLPPGISELNLYTVVQVLWNPVYEGWILIQFHGTNPNLFTPEGFLRLIPITVVYNMQTGQMISVDALYSSYITTSPIAWSSDGRKIVLQTDEDVGSLTRMISFENPQGTPSLTPMTTADGQNQVLLDWLGVDNLLLTANRDSQTNDVVYYISQIIGGEWHTQEFLRLPDTQFERVGESDWHLTASEDEKHALSCLFDQAMPTQLSIGTRARVNFTDGTPLRLRTEPDFESTEITQMPEETEFDVIGGPACVNSDFYYRFWQLELDDGTVGWAAEANNTDYFIEPVEQVE